MSDYSQLNKPSQEFLQGIQTGLEGFFQSENTLLTNVYCLGSLESTQDLAREISRTEEFEKLSDFVCLQAQAGSGNASLLISEEQTKGRGQREAVWYSPSSEGLYFSLIIAQRQPLERLNGLSIVVGLAICEALTLCGVECGVKWPNDVVVLGTEPAASKKLAGILIESSVEGEDIKSVVIGVGINVLNKEFPLDVPGASLFSETEIEFDLSRVLQAFLRVFQQYYGKLHKKGFAAFIQDWSENSILIGAKVSVVNANQQSVSVEGRVIGISNEGALILEETPGAAPFILVSGQITEIIGGLSGGKTVSRQLKEVIEQIEDPSLLEELTETIEQEGEKVISQEMIQEGASDSIDLSTAIRDMKLGEKMKLALLGNMTARSLLIRDPNRLVRGCVLRNPRMTDNEIYEFARNPNIEDQVLRVISKSKSWMKNYPIKAALIMNPKTPIDVSVRWLKHLKDKELRILTKSKMVPSALVNQARKLLEVRTKK